MNKIASIAFLLIGCVLLYFGYREAQTFGSGVHHIFTGSPNDKSTWMVVAGIIATVAGLLGLGQNMK